MFVNCSNHPYEIWNDAQKKASAVYGEVKDIPFPIIPPHFSAKDIRELAKEYAEKIEENHPEAVLVAGEFTFCFMLVDKLLTDGINVVSSCSKRMTEEVKKDDGTNEKKSVFLFEQYRKYEYFKEGSDGQRSFE